MDSMAAYSTKLVKEVSRKSGVFLAIIPGGLTKILHPLDLSPNHSFKSYIWQQAEDRWQMGYTLTLKVAI